MNNHFRDSDFASLVQTALAGDVWVPNTVTAEVREGAVTLLGQVKWNFQRDAAERSVHDLRAAGKVHNNIVVATWKGQDGASAISQNLRERFTRVQKLR